MHQGADMLESKIAWHMGLSGVGALAVAVACGSSRRQRVLRDSLGVEKHQTRSGSGADSGGDFFEKQRQRRTSGGRRYRSALPPEQETKVNSELPAAGQHFVYVANPDSNTVSVIDAKSLAIQTVQAGAQPTFLQSLGGADAAIVLNVGSFDATIVRTKNGTASTTSTVGVQRGSNAIAVAPDGLHAVVYYDETFASGTGTPGSFQDVSVISLAEGNDRSTGMTVGFRPSSVFFSSDGQNAFVVTEDGVSLLNFAAVEKNGAGIANTVSLGSTGTDQTLDVSVTSDGRYALARSDTSSVLRLVDLGSGKIMSLDLATVVATSTPPDAGAPPPSADAGATSDGGTEAGAPPTVVPPPPVMPPGPVTITDVDLAPSGAYAMAVVRELSAAVRLPIPDAFTDGSKATVTTVWGEVIGSVTLSPSGKYALLYTTAVDTNERITILGLDPPAAPRSYQLRQSIASVAIAPDDQTALIVHKKLTGDPNEVRHRPGHEARAPGRLQRRSTRYRVREIAGHRSAARTVRHRPGQQSALHPVQRRESLRGAAGRSAELPRSGDRARKPAGVRRRRAASSNRVFVGQDHPDGRISFIDWTTGAVQSVTGFELNSRIVE